MWARLRRLWRNLRHQGEVDADLQAELAAVSDILAAEKIATGLSPEQARRSAAADMGGLEAIKEAVRATRRGAWLDTAAKDVRFGARLLRRNPLFTTTAALSLAIGIGATTAIFSVANGLLLQTAPGVAEPDELVDISPTRRGGPPGIVETSYPDFAELQQRATTLASVYAYQLNLSPVSLGVDGDGSERAYATLVSSSYFNSLGVAAAAGRLLTSADSEKAGASPLVVLSHRFWSQRFNRDPSVVGRSIRVNGLACTVIGVAGESFHGTTILSPDLWLSLGMTGLIEPGSEVVRLTTRRAAWLMLGGRRQSAVTAAQVSAEVQQIAATFQREAPTSRPRAVGGQDIGAGISARTPSSITWSAERSTPIPSGVRTLAAGFIGLLMGLVSVVLLITCVNLAGVLLARATDRRREIGVRAAIGAGRGRIVRQLLTETLALFLLGSFGALFLARLIRGVLLTLLPVAPVPLDLHMPLDGRVMAFAGLTGLLAALLSGIAPAIHASGADIVSALKDGDAPRTRLWLRHAFVVAQVAFSLGVIVVAALLVTALRGSVKADRGFDGRGVDVASVDLQTAGYTPATGPAFIQQLLERARAIPGVTDAAVANRLPDGAMSLGYLRLPGAGPDDPLIFMNWTVVMPGYFRVLRIPVVAGRDFSDSDRASTPAVAIIGETAARRLWPGRDPIGQSLLAYDGNPEFPSEAPPVLLQIVGIARDLGNTAPGRLGMGQLGLYVPMAQRYQPQVALFVRSEPPATLASELRRVIESLDRNLAILTADRLEHQLAGPVETQLRIAAVVAGGVGLIGLLLAALGVYGVTSYAVTRRTREIAIRLSLGAVNGEVIGLVLRQGLSLVAIGAGLGVLMAVAAGSILATRQLGVSPPGPTILGAGVLLFALVGLIACYVPVRRASRINAMEALRAE